MQSLANELNKLRSAPEALPDESACPGCGYFDVSHPDVRRILHDRDPSHRIFFQAQCKCKSREELQRSQEALRYAQAALPYDRERTLTNFKRSPGTETMVAAAQRFASREGARTLVLVGRTGTGKSHLLEAIGRQALDAGRSVRYDLTSSLLNRLRHTYDSDNNGEDLHDLMGWYQRIDCLMIDDIGVESPTHWAREQLTTLVEERLHGARWTVISTNLNKDAMADRMGDRLASRLWATNPDLSEVEIVINTAQDYRA
jgi:DNA replication protein DnaC